jgi:hypothetical protein
MNRYRIPRGRYIALMTNKQEEELFDLIKEHFGRQSDSDMLRKLLLDAAEKHLPKSTRLSVEKKYIAIH